MVQPVKNPYRKKTTVKKPVQTTVKKPVQYDRSSDPTRLRVQVAHVKKRDYLLTNILHSGASAELLCFNNSFDNDFMKKCKSFKDRFIRDRFKHYSYPSSYMVGQTKHHETVMDGVYVHSNGAGRPVEVKFAPQNYAFVTVSKEQDKLLNTYNGFLIVVEAVGFATKNRKRFRKYILRVSRYRELTKTSN